MGQSAHAWLNDLSSLFTPSPTQFDGAKSHRSSVETRLEQDYGLSDFFEIGSLRHGTGVWKFSDADYLASLKGIRPTSPWTMLDKVKSSLDSRFYSTTVNVSRPAVVCHFSDGDVEIVPGYSAANGGYWIANPADGWMLTHPKDHNSYVNGVNSKHNGSAKRLARHLKIWKYQRNVPVSSCYLEMRAAKYLDGESSYAEFFDLHGVLKLMHDADLASMNDPTGLGSRFGAYSSESKKKDALSKLGRAVTRARKAKEFANEGKQDEAIEQLKLLFNR